MSTSTFHLFPLLPSELRLKIWEFALPGPLIIPFHTAIPDRGGGDNISITCLSKIHLFVPSQKPPSLFHVNSESRLLISSKYQTGFTVCQDIVPPNYYQYGSDSSDTETDEDFLERTRRRERKRALWNMFFPCHHEAIILNKHQEIFWNPDRDIIQYTPLFQVDPSRYTKNTAYVWSFHGYKDLKVRGVKNLAFYFEEFKDWIDFHPDHRIFCDAENIYVILTRLIVEDERVWEEHKAWFKAMFERTVKDYEDMSDDLSWGDNLQRYNVKIVQSLEGDIEEGAWKNAVDLRDVKTVGEDEFEGGHIPLSEEHFHELKNDVDIIIRTS